MPTDTPQSRPKFEGYLSNSSERCQRRSSNQETSSDSPSNTPPSTSHKVKGVKPHVVGARLHTRVPSHGKALHKLTKAHLAENHVTTKAQRRPISPATSPDNLLMKRSGSEPKLSRNGSTTSLKKNSSQVSLTHKRNRSHVEVKRPKSAGALKRSASQPGVNNNKGLNKTTVHFDLGNDGQDDGWTEASGSASPELSRAGSVGGHSSGRSSGNKPASANNSQPHSPTTLKTREWTPNRQNDNHPTLDAHQITSRLLQRTPSLNAPPKMSSISVTATARNQSPEPFGRSSSTLNGTPRNTHEDELSSRFVNANSASGTPGSTSPFLSQTSSDPKPDPADLDSTHRAKSMGNLNSRTTSDDSDERPLAPRSRKSSKGTHTYIPPQQSRTQQKLWLQRASSNIEPQQMAPGAAINGLGLGIGMPGIRPGAPLVGAGDDGRDPRIRLQLERTGLEYLVVRRYQDPVGRALKRLDKLPGANKHRRIPSQRHLDRNGATADSTSQRSLGLSQSLRETRRVNRDGARENGAVSASGARSSYEPVVVHGSVESERSAETEDGVSAILRSMWQKNLDLSASEE
jgi:hypothetical protein